MNWRLLSEILVKASVATRADPITSRIFDLAREAALKEQNK